MRRSISAIIRFGLDPAKSSFAVCGVDALWKIVLRKTLRRDKLLEFFANTPPAIIEMEAGSGDHHWVRELIGLGHDTRIIDPRLIAPYRNQGQAGKNDFNDAVAICEAAGRPRIPFILIKSKEQQAILLEQARAHRMGFARKAD